MYITICTSELIHLQAKDYLEQRILTLQILSVSVLPQTQQESANFQVALEPRVASRTCKSFPGIQSILTEKLQNLPIPPVSLHLAGILKNKYIV